MTLKEKFESHPVVFGGGLLIAGLVAGIQVQKYLFPEKVSPPSQSREVTKATSCTIQGLEAVEKGHRDALVPLHEQLLKLEASSSEQIIISTIQYPHIFSNYQDRYKEAADRIRQDIAVENASYQNALELLSSKCE